MKDHRSDGYQEEYEQYAEQRLCVGSAALYGLHLWPSFLSGNHIVRPALRQALAYDSQWDLRRTPYLSRIS